MSGDAHHHHIVCLLEAPGEVSCNGTIYKVEEFVSPTEGLFWVYLLLYILFVLFAGLMSGLTMGLLSLDVLSLEVLKRGGQPKEKKYATRILKLVRHHHLLLVTLLLANAIAVESMPIFLSKITNEVVAIIVSVTAVLFFGEIFPQALCTRFGLAIGYYCSPIVFFLIVVFFVISFPLAKLLDCILGKGHGTFFRRAELRHLVQIHGSGTDHAKNEEPLNHDEVLIVQSCLEMRDKTVGDAMTPLESVFMLNINECIGLETMDKLIHYGHSRIPVFQNTREDVVGLLLVKKLIKLDPDDCTPVSNLKDSFISPPSCNTSTPLFDILNKFQEGRSHLYLVYDTADDPSMVGIITMEDVIEELIGEEILDETDLYVDVHKRISVARARVQLHRQQYSNPENLGKQSPSPRVRKSFFKRSTSNPEASAKGLASLEETGPATEFSDDKAPLLSEPIN